MRTSGQRQSARFQEGAGVRLHEELPVGVVVIRHRCLRRGGQPAQNHADAGLGESLAMLGARRAEDLLDTIIAVTATRLAHAVAKIPHHTCARIAGGQKLTLARCPRRIELANDWQNAVDLAIRQPSYSRSRDEVDASLLNRTSNRNPSGMSCLETRPRTVFARNANYRRGGAVISLVDKHR
jgi:hypothetical protein